jgi:hypothetical protein
MRKLGSPSELFPGHSFERGPTILFVRRGGVVLIVPRPAADGLEGTHVRECALLKSQLTPSTLASVMQATIISHEPVPASADASEIHRFKFILNDGNSIPLADRFVAHRSYPGGRVAGFRCVRDSPSHPSSANLVSCAATRRDLDCNHSTRDRSERPMAEWLALFDTFRPPSGRWD